MTDAVGPASDAVGPASDAVGPASDAVGPASDVGGCPAAPEADPFPQFAALPLGSRVVVRYRVGELATDALGVLLRRSGDSCDIRTRRGDVTVHFTDIVAAKQVPPPPAPRTPRPRGPSS